MKKPEAVEQADDKTDAAVVQCRPRFPPGHPVVHGGPAGGISARAQSNAPAARKWCSTAARFCRSSTSPNTCRTAVARTPANDPMQVVVYSEQGRSVGLVVGKINDIVQQAHHGQPAGQPRRHPGLGGHSRQSHRPAGCRRASSARPTPLSTLKHNHLNSSDGKLQTILHFFLNGLFFGVEVLKVQEVIRYQEMTRVPLAPAMIRG